MSAVATAIVGGAIIGGISSNKASNAQVGAANRATDISQAQYDQTRADYAPTLARGNAAGDKLAMLLGLSTNGSAPADPLYGSLAKSFTGADLANEPGYRFGLRQGGTAIERSASAGGGLYSGATLKALQRYGQDYGGTKFNEAFNRDKATKDQLYNQLAGLADKGMIGSSQVASAGSINAQTIGNNILGAGNAQAANSLSRGNILQNGINQGLSMWQRANTGGNGVGSGSTFFNDPTDVSGWNAMNGSDVN